MKNCTDCPDKCLFCETLLCSCQASKPPRPLQAVIQKHSLAPKDILFHEGEPASRLFLLSSGCTKLTTALPDGRNQGLRLGMARQFIGFEGLNEQRYSYTAEAITPVQACSLRYQDMLHILEQSPQLAMAVIGILNRELRRSNATIRNLGQMSSTERIASFLLTLRPSESDPQDEILLPLSRTDMAEMLGLTLETVSRILSRMSHANIIRLQPGGRLLHILDQEGLARMSCDLDDSPWPQLAAS